MPEVIENEEEFVDEVKGSFDLSAKLRGRPMRTGAVVVYTDEVTAERIQTIEAALQQLTDMPAGFKSIADAARNMGLEEVADNLDKIVTSGIHDIDEYNKLEEEKAELVEVLKQSALKIELQAIPKIVLKDCRRQAKKHLGIKGNIPEERIEEFSDVHTAIALTKAVTSTRDAEGHVNTTLTIDAARDLFDYLPDSEWSKIDQALADLGYRDVISGAITDDPDF